MPGPGHFDMYKVQFVWSGWPGQYGYTTFYFNSTTGTQQAAHDAGRAFLVTAAGTANNNLPAAIRIACPSQIDTVAASTGALVSSASVTPGATIVGNGSGNFSSAAGACVTWLTADILTVPPHRPHRVRGRTFLVPLSQNGLDTDGSLSSTMLANLTSAATTLIAASPKLVVWHRPTAIGAADGAAFDITAARIIDKSAVLTSRRD